MLATWLIHPNSWLVMSADGVSSQHNRPSDGGLIARAGSLKQGADEDTVEHDGFTAAGSAITGELPGKFLGVPL